MSNPDDKLTAADRRRQTDAIRQIVQRLTKEQRERFHDKAKDEVSRSTLNRVFQQSGHEAFRTRQLDALTDVLKNLGFWRDSDAEADIADGIPTSAYYNYEKQIVDFFSNGGPQLEDFLRQALLSKWPDLERVGHFDDKRWIKENPIPENIFGRFRKPEDRIFVEARTSIERQPDDNSLTFLEAGPRKKVCFPFEERLRVGILVSGGIAPGINAIIDGIVERHELYQRFIHLKVPDSTLKILGYNDGLAGLLTPHLGYKELTSAKTRPAADRAGSLIGTSRLPSLEHGRPAAARQKALEEIVTRFVKDSLDVVYILGGDGTMKAAHALHTVAKSMQQQGRLRRVPSILAVPKTMDNDVLWLWQSLGFQAAVARATELIKQLYTEAFCNPRLCIVQLYGSESGFMVSHAALASGVCDAALIPEVNFTMEKLADHVKQVLRRRFNRDNREDESPHGMILVAETSIPQDAEEFLEDEGIGLSKDEKDAIRHFLTNNRRVHGQTPDELRSGGLKIIEKVLEREIKTMKTETEDYWGSFRVFANQPRHLVRAIAPTGIELIFGHRLGTLAVDTAMAGYTDCMISQWLTEYVVVPLSLVVLGKKRVRTDGIFWRSVIASTNQPDNLA